MSNRKKLGIFLPERPENHMQLNSQRTAIGCLRAEINTPLLEILRAAKHVDLVEDLDFRNALIQNGGVYCENQCLNDLDRFFWYCEVDRNPGSFDLEVLKTLSRSVDVIRDPCRFETGLDKYRAHLCLQDAGVRVAESVLFDHRIPGRMADILEEWGAGVLKPRRGGWGKGVTLIDSAARLRDIVGYVGSTLEQSPDQGFFLERYYENDPDKWASVTMINGEIVYGYRKVSVRFHDFGNGRLKVQDTEEKGGGVVLAKLTPEHEAQAYLAYEALGLELIGFDMIWTYQGPVIVDENTSPGNYINLYSEVGRNPAELLANWILQGL
jgi:glutathione synthase/RimK-type ligase-like ATP-grasp enzyme